MIRSCEVRIVSELLALEIHDRLGQPLDVMDDPYTRRPYWRDEATGEWFSAGSDGLPGTADDLSVKKSG